MPGISVEVQSGPVLEVRVSDVYVNGVHVHVQDAPGGDEQERAQRTSANFAGTSVFPSSASAYIPAEKNMEYGAME